MTNSVVLRAAKPLGGLVAVLVLIALAFSFIAPPTARAQTDVGGSSDAAANSVTSYLSSKGYDVVDVGYVTGSNGQVDRTTVGAIMVLASPSFDPTEPAYQDAGVIQQAVEGFYALRRYYPRATTMFSALEIDRYWLVFPATGAAFQQALDGKVTGDQFWAGVTRNYFILDKQTGEEVSAGDFADKNFGNNDFGDKGNNGPPLPTDNPNNQPPPNSQHTPGNGYLRMQPSSAFVPAGGQVVLVATVNDKDYRPASGQDVIFSAQQTGSDEQSLGSERTGNDGAARGSLTLAQPAGELRLKATVDSRSDVNVDSPASTVVLSARLAATGDGIKQQVADALALQGYNVQQVDYSEANDIHGDYVAEGAVYMDMASKQFDQTLRAQMLSGWGTMFTVYDKLKSTMVALLYPQGGKLYVIVYSLSRSDWQAWVGGQKSEPDLWKTVSLLAVIDGRTGERVSGDTAFVDKNFGSNGNTQVATTENRTVETKVVKERWNARQIYDDNIVIPLGGFADNFKVASKQGTGDWAIYQVNDPTAPVYSSKQGDKLNSLRLGSGNYIIVALGDPGQTVRVTYQEHLSR